MMEHQLSSLVDILGVMVRQPSKITLGGQVYLLLKPSMALKWLGSELRREEIGGQDSWFFAPEDVNQFSIDASYILPNFDEYIIGYSDKSAIFDESYASGLDARHNPLFQHTIVMNGRIAGTWKRTLQKTKLLFLSSLL